MSLRDAFSRIASSVSVVTYDRSGVPHGTTLTSVITLSLEPPLMGFALGRCGGTLGHLATGTRFGLSVLADDQQALAARCALPRRGPLEERLVARDGEGTPALRGGVAAFRLTVVEWADAGDHVFVVARIESAEEGGGLPLLYVGRGYARATSSAAGSSSSCRRRSAPA